MVQVYSFTYNVVQSALPSSRLLWRS